MLTLCGCHLQSLPLGTQAIQPQDLVGVNGDLHCCSMVISAGEEVVHSLCRPDFCYVSPGLWLVNLAVLVYLPLTQRGSPPLKVNVKIFQLGTTFYFLVKSMNVQCVRVKIVTSLLKNSWLDFEYLLCTNPMGFFRCSPLVQRRLVGKYTERISRRRSPTKRIPNDKIIRFFAD